MSIKNWGDESGREKTPHDWICFTRHDFPSLSRELAVIAARDAQTVVDKFTKLFATRISELATQSTKSHSLVCDLEYLFNDMLSNHPDSGRAIE